jgi:WD40 repeat protein
MRAAHAPITRPLRHGRERRRKFSTMDVMRKLEHHTDDVVCLAFSPDGSVLASGSEDKSVVLVDPKSGNVLHKLKHHTGWVTCISFPPDGSVLASAGSKDKSVVLVDPKSGNVLHTLEHHTDDGYCISFSDPRRQRARVRVERQLGCAGRPKFGQRPPHA